MWLLLIHQIPPNPSYLRVKVRRRLTKLGALQVKSTVYVLPAGGSNRSKFEWLAKEIRTGGGEAILVEARFVGGYSEDDVRDLFRADREAHYEKLHLDIEELINRGPGPGAAAQLGHLKRRFAAVRRLDFFDAPGGRIAKRSLEAAESALKERAKGEDSPDVLDLHTLRGRLWVTRRGVHVDRMASAWLIGRFIDPDASFRFVDPDEYRHAPGEIRFDMYDAEFTHDGDLCTFQVLSQLARPQDPALREIAEIVHDVDLKDEKFGRIEAAGISRVVEGIQAAIATDEERVAHGRKLFEGLYRSFGGAG
ncbi:MAG: ChrB protein [Gemmatimonas sp.]|nr:ChrB protein [Gemmatimonas sp.]